MESVSGSDVGLRRVGTVGLGHMARQDFARGRSRRCDGVGAFIFTDLHRIDIALRHRGAHGDNYEVQCSPDVRKKPSFTHVRANLRGDVSGKRFSTHAMERNVARIGEGRCGNDKGMERAEGE